MIFAVGLSHRTAPVAVRERLAVSPDAAAALVRELTERARLDEVMLLSTCNRFEVFARSSAEDAGDRIRDVIAARAPAHIYVKSGRDAVRHVFRVATSLDSMVLGEPQILGQVKDAHDAAAAAGTLKSHLARCVHRAIYVARRVRSETAIGAGLVSVSSVAVDLAKKIFVDLAGHAVLLVGAGEMAEAAAKALAKGGQPIRVCNRSFDRGEALAGQFGGEARDWSELEAEIARADVVVTSTASPSFVVTEGMVRRAVKHRRGRALFFIDIAVPRNVEPSVHGLDNVYVFNVDDLEEQVAANLKMREAEVALAERIVDDEVDAFDRWARGLDVQPTVVELRAKVRGILGAELERTLSTRLKHLGEAERAALVQMVESATNKVLHAPTTRLKSAAACDGGEDLAGVVRQLFDLGDERARLDQATAEDAPPEDDRVRH